MSQGNNKQTNVTHRLPLPNTADLVNFSISDS